MAYFFTSSSSQHMTATSVVTAVPLTIAAWFTTMSDNLNGVLCSVGETTNHCRLSLSNGQIQALAFGSATGISLSAGAVTIAGGPAHCAAVFSGTASRQAYLNGVAATVDTTSVTQSAFNEVIIGARRNTTVGQFANGTISEVAIWNVALNADEIAALAKGFSPRLIRPTSLRDHFRLIRMLSSLRSGSILTNVNGATVADHHRIIHT